jgi:hypothetical protein
VQQQLLPDPGPGALPVDHRLQVAAQVRPARLAPAQGDPVISRVVLVFLANLDRRSVLNYSFCQPFHKLFERLFGEPPFCGWYDPNVAMVHVIKCLMHYHQDTLARQMAARGERIVNSF